MKVMQVIAGGPVGGAETFFVSLSLALHQAGLQQKIVMRPNDHRRAILREGGLDPLELPFGSRWVDWSTRRGLKKAVNEFQPDLVMTWMKRASSHMPRGDFLRTARVGGFYNLKYFLNYDHLFCITPKICDHMVAQGFAREKTHYIPNFATLEQGEAIARSALNTPQDVPLILALGRLHPCKGLDVLLKALTLEKRAYLWLAGDGPLRQELEDLTDELGLRERVRFLGWHQGRGSLFAAADICVMPSRYEAFGTVCLESWAAGKVLIAAKSAGPAGLIRHDEDGLLFNVDDVRGLASCLTRVIDQPATVDRLVSAGLARYYSAEFTKQHCVESYLNKFEELLAKEN